MTRSIFDPTGPNTERSGSRYGGPDADNRSNMPESAIDGEVERPANPADDIVDLGPDTPTAQTPPPLPASDQT